MQPRTKNLLKFLVRPHIDQTILFLSQPRTEKAVMSHLQVSQSTAARALREMELWGIAASERPKLGQRSKAGRPARVWRLSHPEIISFLDRSDHLMSTLLHHQVNETEAASDEARRDRIEATEERAA